MLILACLVWVTACRSEPTPAPSVNAETAAATSDPSLNAMLVIHAHTRLQHLAGLVQPAMFDFGSLSTAIGNLAADTSPLAWSRRRRAIAALMATGWGDRRFDQHVEVLRGQPDKIRAAVTATHPNASSMGPDGLERVVYNLEDGVFFAPGTHALAKCWQKEPGNYVDFATGSRTIVIGSSVSVPTTLAWGLQEVKASVDPQQWDTCSGFWPDGGTYLIARTTPPWTPPPLPEPMKNPPSPGSLWAYPSFLFEHFICSKNCSAEFQIVLATSVESRAVAHTVTYRLADSGVLLGRVGSAAVRPVIDQGKLEVWQNAAAGPVYVMARKELMLDDESANQLAYWAFLNYEQERGLGELACCLNR